MTYDTALELHAQSLREYATARGYEIAGVVKEIGSGLTLDRPGIRKIREMASLHAIDEMLAKSISRYARGPVSMFVGFIGALADMGVDAATTVQDGD